MYRLGLWFVLVGCGKSEPKVATPTGPAPVKAEAPGYADVKGVVVTAGDVRFNGKSIGVLGERLVTDQSVLVGQIREALGTGARPKETLVLSYTDDAPAPVVLAGMRAVVEATKRPASPPDDKASTGTAMALDEGKMGKTDDSARARQAGDLGASALTGESGGDVGQPYKIVALGGRDAKPQVVCEPRASFAGPDERETVKLALTFGASDWHLDLTRVNESIAIASLAELSTKLKEKKTSAFFSERPDVELVAKAGAVGANVTPVLAAACSTGFLAIQAMTVEELKAQVEASAVPDGPTVALGIPNVQGGLDRKAVSGAVKREQQKVLACYTAALAKQPALHGTVTARFSIGADGRVTATAAADVDPALDTCIDGVIKGIAFDKPTSGEVGVNYPFTFRRAAKP